MGGIIFKEVRNMLSTRAEISLNWLPLLVALTYSLLQLKRGMIMPNYIVLEAQTLNYLEIEVNRYLEKGYEVVGGVSAIFIGEQPSRYADKRFYQAMIAKQ